MLDLYEKFFMIENQLVTVIIRVWQVFHIIDGNLIKSENSQNRKD